MTCYWFIPTYILFFGDLWNPTFTDTSLTVKGKKVKSSLDRYNRQKPKDNTEDAIKFLNLLSSKKTSTKVVKQVGKLLIYAARYFTKCANISIDFSDAYAQLKDIKRSQTIYVLITRQWTVI